jgi:hypothetical protein
MAALIFKHSEGARDAPVDPSGKRAGHGVRRRVLLVVSSYRPAMLADMQRARALAWELPALGWDVEILAPAVDAVRQDAIEPYADGFFAPATLVHQVAVRCQRLFNLVDLGSGVWRLWLPMFWRGRALLASGRFDLVYFSTTAFNLFFWGPLWRRRFTIPYILDFQDPWVLPKPEYIRLGWKGRLAVLIDPAMERRAVRAAAGLVAVSPGYIDTLKRRYGKLAPLWLQAGRHAVIPFCALERDLVEATKGLSTRAASSSHELRLIYVGEGCRRHSFSLVCRVLSRLRANGDELAARVRIRLYGTRSIGMRHAEAARNAGVGDLVEERPERVPYRRALELLIEGRGLLILGADDAGYMPSKLFGYALSGNPLLACLRKDGPAYALFEAKSQLGQALWFDAAGSMPLDQAAAIFRRFLEDVAAGIRVDRRAILEEHSGAAMARRHAQLFDACLPEAPE